MKRNIALLLLIAVLATLALFFMPASLAKKDRKEVTEKALAPEKKAPTFPDLFKPNDREPIFGQDGQDQAQTITVGWSVKNDESPALRDMKVQPVKPQEEEKEANENPKLPYTHIDLPDPVIQSSFGALRGLLAPNVMPSPILNFDGILFPGVACNCAPPDTDGEVGLTQYVQMVNNGFQVFDKTTSASTFGPAGITTLWSGFGGVCQNTGRGDPVVMYDQLADRWIITQFAGAPVPTDECIAVSKTGDATGAYYRYDFNLGTNFFDYPHLGVWPDGYYMSMNVFNTAGSAFLGPQAFVFDRARMLAGLSASFQTPGVTGGPSEDSFLPADLDGYSLPPVGAPNSFVETPFTGTYRTWHFHVDFAIPANSTFTLFASPAAAGFTELCPTTRACVPQLGGTGANSLDAIGDRLMYRLAYRNIGGVESLVGNHTVSASAVAGIRWFELRGVTAGPVTVFQESTYQPDTTWRWMGSAAMDNQGNLALGFSASDATINPQIRYAGRLVTDPANSLAQGEATLFAGTGSQTGTSNRWGDYSDMTVDPSDDCTFWYTQEYYSATGAFNWRTRIGNFKYPVCTTSARGTISGTITNCSTGLPIPNAQVSITGGYGRATGAAGTYSAIVTPGTYNASVTGIGYDTASTTGLVVSNGGNAAFSACLNAIAPEITVAGNGSIDIVDGDSTPSVTDGTDFGIANITGGTVVHTFTVQNIGAVNLTVGLPTTTGPNAADFTVTLAPGSPVVPAGSTTFQVTFDPSASGPRTATLSFANNDPDENPFDFSIAGTGTNGSATCPQVVLPNDGSTSGNARAPQTRNQFERSVYLIKATELAAAGFTAGTTPTTIGWTYTTGGTAGSAPLILYLENTSDTTNLKSTTWATAISSMTMVHNATTALPAAAGPFDFTLTGGSPFTYTGGGLYVAFDWGQYTGTLGTTTVVSCNSTGLVNGLLGAQSNVSAPTTTAASSFRPETRLNGILGVQNDAAVSLVFSYGELPLGLATQATKALITNVGAAPLTNLPVTLNVTGVDTFTDTQNIPSLAACGGQATVTFAPFTPGAVGSDTLTVSVPADDIPGNNSQSKPLNVTFLNYSYKYPGSTASGGVGFTGGTGAFVGKFTTTAANSVGAVKLEFNAVTTTTYRVAIYGDNGGIPSTTALYVDAADRTVSAAGPVTITLSPAVAVGPGNFYVGIQQTNTTNANLSFDSETPIRSGAFFLASPNPPTAWFDFSPGNNFKLNVGVVLVTPTAANGSIGGTITDTSGTPLGGAVMHLSGAATRTTVSDSSGNYHFDNLDTDNFYTVTPSLANYQFAPANRSFSLVGNITDAAFTANADASQSANAIDMTEYFVRQQYLDFLGREPDQGGFEYWSYQINQCGGDAACIRQRRIDVSAAFFASTEFQQTGTYIYGVYAGTLGRTLNYGEFNADRSQVLGGSGLDPAKTAFAQAFIQRPEFTSRYPQGITREQFVDAVIQTMTQRSGVDQSSLRDGFLSDYDSGGRALVVRHASEASSFVAAEYNKAFVLMEYFGYLRRETDQGGYDYWLDVLNNGAVGNYRGMVCAFLTSTEYQLRFSTVVTRSNADCGQ
jgi:hypothetical protein